MTSRSRSNRVRRDGAVLLAVLVCLGIASAITGVAIHRSLRARRQMNHEWQLEQTRTLLDAGIRRTHRSVAENSDYVGESWNLDGALESYATARVEIKTAGDESTNTDEPAVDNDELVAISRRFKVTATIQNRDVNPFQTKRSRIVTVHPAKSDTSNDVGDMDSTETADNEAGD